MLAGFVEKLPEIAESMDIDRYTVFAGSGESPLAHSLAQVLSLLEEHGLRKFLQKDNGTGTDDNQGTMDGPAKKEKST